MADADDRLDFCKQALGELGTRSTITSLDPPDGSQETYYCNLFFDGTRDQILRAAHWNFARHTDTAPLWKAAPGTPENLTPPGHAWSHRDPIPPWLYAYKYLGPHILQIRRIREGGQTGDVMFSSVSTNGPCVSFDMGVDNTDRNGTLLSLTKTVSTITVIAPGSGYQGADYIFMAGNDASLMGQPVKLQVTKVTTNGGVVEAFVHDGGTFTETPVSISQSATSGNGVGFACAPITVASLPNQKVILTNARNIIMDFTTSVFVAQYDPLFADAFMLALEGKLALALLGDRALYGAKLQEANNSIIEARVRDANEGLTVYDFVPDWIQARGVASGAALNGWLPQYGPLFSV